MSTYPVQVSNISHVTTKEVLHDFFTFCGQIHDIDFNKEKHTATVYFEKSSAARTALMLNGGTLDGTNLEVTSTSVTENEHSTEPDATTRQAAEGEHISQEDKPKAGIVAEYLAKGYTLSTPILQRAIEIDQKNGISSRFLSYIKSIDQTLGSKIAGPESTLSETAMNRGKQLDQKHGITTRANTYYEKAITSPWGKSVFEFYSSTQKQVIDIHEEAKRIAAHKAETGAPASAPATGTSAASPVVPVA